MAASSSSSSFGLTDDFDLSNPSFFESMLTLDAPPITAYGHDNPMFKLVECEKNMKYYEYQWDRVEEAVFNSVSEMGAESGSFYC